MVRNMRRDNDRKTRRFAGAYRKYSFANSDVGGDGGGEMLTTMAGSVTENNPVRETLDRCGGKAGEGRLIRRVPSVCCNARRRFHPAGSRTQG